MTRHVVLGAGPVGRSVAGLFLQRGDDVVVATRSGTEVAGAASAALPATDPALRDLLDGVASVTVAVNPPYHRWAANWPPVIDSVIKAAASAAVPVLLIGNLYAHARGVTMTADTPLDPPSRKGAVRADVWRRLIRAHTAGLIRAAEVRASDYVGPEAAASTAHAGGRFVDPILTGRTAWVLGDPDVRHSWAAVGDIARTAVAVIDQAAWGRPWVVPTTVPRSLNAFAGDLAQAAGAPPPRVKQLPRGLLRIGGLVSPLLRELDEVRYQHVEPFVSDGSETTARLGVSATPWPDLVSSLVVARQPGLTGRHRLR
ncbi:MAG: NAD-dependent epimerase [Propioniciclava sp.]